MKNCYSWNLTMNAFDVTELTHIILPITIKIASIYTVNFTSVNQEHKIFAFAMALKSIILTFINR